MDHLQELLKSNTLTQFNSLIETNSSVVVEKLSPSMKAFLIMHASKLLQRPIIVLTGAGSEEFKLFNNLPFFGKTPLIEVPAWETLPSENIAPSSDIVGQRFLAFKELQEQKRPSIILTSLQAALQKTIPHDWLDELSFTLHINDTLTLEDLVKKLYDIGYERKTICSDKGEFATRGGIIDLFPISSMNPIRIEFWDDTIETMRSFDPASQKSKEGVIHEANIAPAKELELTQLFESELESLFSFTDSNSLIVFDDLEALEERYASLSSLGSFSSKHFLSLDELFQSLEKHQKLFFANTSLEKLTEVRYDSKPEKAYGSHARPVQISFQMFFRTFSSSLWHHPFEPLPNYFERVELYDEPPQGDQLLDALHQSQLQTFFICQNEAEETSLTRRLHDKGLSFAHSKVITGYLSDGFALKDHPIALFPLTELTKRIKVRKERQRPSFHFTPTDAFDISPGEAVVHYHHGIGKFIAFEKKKNHLGTEQEFFVIEYNNNSKLFVPLSQAHLITRYIGSKEETPKLHVLGSSKWKRCRENTEKSLIGYANELLKMYAEREIEGGFSFPTDSPETALFEEEFPYIETEDQLLAIREVKEDMSSKNPMDRLVCGDVGYGKTEVALRAAFKAIMDGKKQVALLVPTTVLAVQHYENFLDRMESFGVSIALLSRFQKPKETKAILEKLLHGSVDIVIGTHKLLGKSVQFKDLGLLIVDEEQRFGVKAKEHLKHLKTGVDCLTLTATPIPRTLHLSLVGARNLSTINTPPYDRVPIKTVITTPEDHIIETALLRELNRDGQAYFIHNRVETIYERANAIKKMLPKARIVIAHGQMSGDEIDMAFHAFKKGEADILVATSIIENGIDIPNANTILIDHADRFGVSDLYQLRGRVGRWNKRAYAYFMIPKNRVLSEVAKKRIEAIAQSGGYGGGIKVAMRDLEMRGAGDILGIDQSGHVSDVGFHLYCKLLKRTIDSLQGKTTSWTADTKVEIPFDAKLPEYYVNDVLLRMEFYQRFGDAGSLKELDMLFEEVEDRFGKAPEPALWLYSLYRIRLQASQKGFTSIKLNKFSCAYERKQGEKTTSNTLLVGPIKTPQDFEAKLQSLFSQD